jgi:hypothetical protein
MRETVTGELLGTMMQSEDIVQTRKREALIGVLHWQVTPSKAP